jgi:hypothetical protein
LYATESFPQYFCALNVEALTGRHFKGLRTAGVNDDQLGRRMVGRNIFLFLNNKLVPAEKLNRKRLPFTKITRFILLNPKESQTEIAIIKSLVYFDHCVMFWSQTSLLSLKNELS